MRVLVTCPRVNISKDAFDEFFDKANIHVDYVFPTNQGFSTTEMIQIYDKHETIIVGDDEVNEEFLTSAPLLKNIIKWGKGVDNIDKSICQKQNISLHNSPSNLAKYVAEHGMSLILSLNKNILINTNSISNDYWYKDPSRTLFDKTVGFYGFGAIAKEFVKLLTPFNTKIIFHDIHLMETDFKQVNIEKLFEKSDIIIVASELTKTNYGQIDKILLDLMKKESILINISRGQIVNEEDLISCLSKKSIRGAGLDVFNKEPIEKTNKLLELDNVVLTCHNASNTNKASIEVNNEILSILETLI